MVTSFPSTILGSVCRPPVLPHDRSGSACSRPPHDTRSPIQSSSSLQERYCVPGELFDVLSPLLPSVSARASPCGYANGCIPAVRQGGRMRRSMGAVAILAGGGRWERRRPSRKSQRSRTPSHPEAVLVSLAQTHRVTSNRFSGALEGCNLFSTELQFFFVACAACLVADSWRWIDLLSPQLGRRRLSGIPGDFFF